MIDIRQTTIEVIDPRSAHIGKQFAVKMSYGHQVFVIDEDNRKTLIFTRDQIKVVHVQDWNNWLIVSGHIITTKWQEIEDAIEAIEGVDLVTGGWTGREGRMSVRCKMWHASSVIGEVQKAVEKYGLMVTKPEPEF